MMSSSASSAGAGDPPRNSIKDTVFLRDYLEQPRGECSICLSRTEDYQFAHVLPKHDFARFDSYRNAGLLPPALDRLGHPDNIIHLCTACHGMMDRQSPRIAVVPNDIQFFIDWELSDYRRRQEAVNRGQPCPKRTVPSATQYTGGSRFYYLIDVLPNKHYQNRLVEHAGSAKINASPTALLTAAGRAICFPVACPPPSGVPESVRTSLGTLYNLWQRPDPEYTGPDVELQKRQRSPSDHEMEGDAPEPGLKKATGNISTASPTKRPRSRRTTGALDADDGEGLPAECDPAGSHDGENQDARDLMAKSRNEDDYYLDEQDWVLGPSVTASDVIAMLHRHDTA
ncbi:hypothetical protein ABW21_db0205458 [Orbilia brochopaga]|nr:hypothetical protein ABW21_db0205458 [Drechslerella brochopaga]